MSYKLLGKDDENLNITVTDNGNVSINIKPLVEVRTLTQLDSDPTTDLVAGQLYFNTTTNKFRGYNGTAWVDLA